MIIFKILNYRKSDYSESTKTGFMYKIQLNLLFIISFLLFFSCNQVEKIANKFNNEDKKETTKEISKETPEEINKIDPYQELTNKVIKAMDYDNPKTRKFAVNLAKKYPGKHNINQLCQIFSYINKNWKYVNDPKGIEYFANASESIELMSGDCDDFAILMATTLKAIGFETRITCAYNKKVGHAFAEVYVNNSEKNMSIVKDSINKFYSNFFDKIFGINKVQSINYRKDSNGRLWLNLDRDPQYPGGEYFIADEGTIIYTDGHYERY